MAELPIFTPFSKPKHWTDDHIQVLDHRGEELWLGFDETGQVYTVANLREDVVEELVAYAANLESTCTL